MALRCRSENASTGMTGQARRARVRHRMMTASQNASMQRQTGILTLTRLRLGSTARCMTKTMNNRDVGKIREDLQRLEQQVERLVQRCARLQEENRVLRQSQDNLNAERASLLEKNETARSRIEAMISRLKAMEQH